MSRVSTTPAAPKPSAPLPAAPRRLQSLGRLIGNTPMFAIDFTFRGRSRRLFAKAEHFHWTGSIKDRMALHVLRRAYAEGRIQQGDCIAEATSGNTGISFAALGRALGHPVTIFMPDWMSRERVELIRSFGATIVPVSREQGGFVGSIRMAEELAAGSEHVFLPRQFANAANVEAHETTTGPEIWQQLRDAGLTIEAFVAGVGTGGTVMGVGRFLRRVAPGVRVYPLEPAESPTLSVGHKIGKHRIQGISDEFVPPIVQLDELDAVVAVSDGDAILMAQKLARTLGIAVGISSGANFLGALLAQETLGHDAIVATVFADSNKKYLSTDLMSPEPLKPDFLSPEVELIGFEVLHRLCGACPVNTEGGAAQAPA
ncbi:MAG: PLP-dependent cysteine synthase family protein [Candidatus Eisenbacteria bacterium]|uniref:cysteine synthase n=1 Tax=Eiseniibacteriota bacterium TaxID=2212470 RepID=A0A933SG68_UNCEI|nr:PLP-dependent cysteine synthase family protein [Candidatus Eisenbacteria bacterium]